MRRKTISILVVGLLAMEIVVSWRTADQRASRDRKSTTGMDADVIYLGAEGVIFQERSNNCGLAALAMVLEHYGIKVSQQSMAGGAKLDFRGASLMTLKERATLEGLEAEGRRLSYEDLLSIRFPAILFVENHHFIVVDSVGGTGELFVRDPAAGRLRVSRKRAAAIWKGETLVITHQGG